MNPDVLFRFQVACAGSSIDAATSKLTEVENLMIAGDEVDTGSVMVRILFLRSKIRSY